MWARLIFRDSIDPGDIEAISTEINVDDDHRTWTAEQWHEHWPALIGVEWLGDDKEDFEKKQVEKAFGEDQWEKNDRRDFNRESQWQHRGQMSLFTDKEEENDAQDE